MKTQHRRRGVIARLDAGHFFAFSRNDKHNKKKTSDSIWPLKVSLLLVLVSGLTGCLWHGESADDMWGPAFIRGNAPPDSPAYLVEQTWFPLLVEGGKRWGLTIGYFNKLLTTPVPILGTEKLADQSQPLFLHLVAPISLGSWKISLFHASTGQAREAAFMQKRLIGVQLSTGLDKEGSNITLGVSRTSLFWPRPDALYLLEFSGDYPLRTRFLVCDAKANESLEPCLREVIQ